MKISKKFIVINICLAAIIATTAVAFAAYTSLSASKRVVSTKGAKQLFSSNILAEYGEEDEISGRAMSFASDAENNTFQITISNYAQGDKTTFSAGNINYKVFVSLLDNSGAVVTNAEILDAYKWGGVAFSLLTQPVNDTLAGGAANDKSYTVTVPTKYMKDYKIKVTAESNNSKHKPLGRIISATEYTATSAWKLTFLNVEQEQHAYDLGCINTKVTGSEHAKLTLTWDSRHLDIDPWFLADMSLAAPIADANGKKSITFEVGKSGGTNQYNIVFYRTSAVHSDDATVETWDDIKSYISLSSSVISDTTVSE